MNKIRTNIFLTAQYFKPILCVYQCITEAVTRVLFVGEMYGRARWVRGSVTLCLLLKSHSCVLRDNLCDWQPLNINRNEHKSEILLQRQTSSMELELISCLCQQWHDSQQSSVAKVNKWTYVQGGSTNEYILFVVSTINKNFNRFAELMRLETEIFQDLAWTPYLYKGWRNSSQGKKVLFNKSTEICFLMRSVLLVVSGKPSQSQACSMWRLSRPSRRPESPTSCGSPTAPSTGPWVTSHDLQLMVEVCCFSLQWLDHWMTFHRTMLSLGTTSGSRPAALEISVMLERNIALPNHWWAFETRWLLNIHVFCLLLQVYIIPSLLCCYFLQQKSVARKKCAGCKISVHTMCMEQLEKVTSGSSAHQQLWFLFLISWSLVSLVRLISGASHHLGNQDLELFERSVSFV